MKVHFTGRQVEVTPLIQAQVQQRLDKIHKILGGHLDLEAHVILSLERHRHDTEMTLNLKNHSLLGFGAAYDFYSSLQAAMEKLEKQAIKYKSRWRVLKRRPATAVAAAAQLRAASL